MGQLSAGIAHELNNPLGVVIMYSNILLDECKEGDPVRDDLKLIVEQAGRCKKIVAGLLNFARKNQVNHQLVSIKDLVAHSLESVIVPEKVTIRISDQTTNPEAMLDSEQMTQVQALKTKIKPRYLNHSLQQKVLDMVQVWDLQQHMVL